MNRRQVLLGSAATMAAAAGGASLAVMEPGIMPFPDPHPSLTAAIKIFWDAKGEVFRVTGISMEELYARGP